MLPRDAQDASWSTRRASRSSTASASVPDQFQNASPRQKSRGRATRSARLWMLLCGCGVFYLVMLFNAGWWSTAAPVKTNSKPMRATLEQPSPPAAVALHQVPSNPATEATDHNAMPSQASVTKETASIETTAQGPTPAAIAASVHTSSPPPSTSAQPSTTTPLSATDPPSESPEASPDTPSSEPTYSADWFKKLMTTTPPPVIPSGPPRVISLEEHNKRMTELEEQRLKAISAVGLLKNRLHKVREQLQIHAAIIAEEDAKLVEDLPVDYKKQRHQRKFRCLGWRATEGCDPNGKRLPAKDRSCQVPVLPRMSGFCEVEDVVTKERFRVVKTSCDSLRHDASMRCFDAWFFPNFAIQSHEVLRNATLAQNPEIQSSSVPESRNPEIQSVPNTRGIIMVVYPKMLPSTYATIRRLRRLGCTLPVEMWYLPKEMAEPSANPIVRQMQAVDGPITLRAIDDERVHGYATKIHAIRHSKFDHVLFLDSDNVPVRNPTYLFDLPEYTTTGALFWPDFWHPNHTIFALHARSLVWEYLDLPFVDMFEQESGQILIDRTRSRVAFELLHLYASHQPNLLDKIKITHGDKDLFRFAWLKSNTSFSMVKIPPAIAGNVKGDTFCGQTMVQYDPRGEMLFLHRNAKKLEGRHVESVRTTATVRGRQVESVQENVVVVDPEIWTHLLQHKPTSSIAEYTVEIYEGSRDFPRGQWCYGKRSPNTPHFNTFRFQDLPVRDVESEIRAYALEATDLLAAVAG